MPISWNIPLVSLSVLIAIVGSFTALAHAERMRNSKGRSAFWWMLSGSITLGLTIWSMHFLGMLAFHLPIPLTYDISPTLISVLPAIASALLGFMVLREQEIQFRRILLSGIVMGIGVSLMHYTGMDALRLAPPIQYDARIIVLSVLLAILASWAALLMMYRSNRLLHLDWLPRTGLSAVIMGLAVSGMHYLAMQGLDIAPKSVCLSSPHAFTPDILGILVTLTAMFWFGGSLLATLFDRRLARQNQEALEKLHATHEEFQQKTRAQVEEMTQSLRESRESLQHVLDSVAEGIYGVDMKGRCTFINRSGVAMLGYADASEIVGQKIHALTHHSHADGRPYPEKECRMYRAYEKGEKLHVDNEVFWRKDGSSFPVEYWSYPIVKEGVVRGAVATFFDISERQRSAQALAQSEKKFRTLYDATSDAIILLDSGRIIDCNLAALKMFGCATREDFCSRHPADFSPPAQPNGQDSLSAAKHHILTAMQTGSSRYEWQHRRVDDYQTFPAEVLLNVTELEGKPIIQATVRDISERKRIEQQVHQLAFYDTLTQLPNRRLLLDRMHQAFAASARTHHHGAVLFLDLDNFKTLNDTKGHEIGDLLLQEVASRLTGCVRDGDTVARQGGDEFVVVLESLSSRLNEAANQAEKVAEKIRAALSQPYQLKGRMHHTTPSIGIALFKGREKSVEDLLKYADIAMYQAKSAGRNAIRFYDPETQSAIEARADLETELRIAMEEGQFQLYYQVQTDSHQRHIGAEALLRWKHPQRGLISPGEFIPVLEESGMIVPAGLWVLQTACRQLSEWQHNPATRNLSLAVNVSAKQFRQKDFVQRVQRTLQESGARPALLKLELTESMVLEKIDDTIAKMRELRLLGVSFSLDDFGTGYSSLQYLKQLPLDQIKIDQSFVRDIHLDPNDAAIVQAIIAMGKALGLHVIAEGVENQAQRDFLDRHGCHAFQGYLFGRPLPLAEFEAALAAAS